ncbi:MAG: SDR family oxidoreductase [Alicyclobacillus macrosporangiidus]|uniref:SDR family oxidoreductase n=1 Tax=Alicyclobacillus macrosporangiidus TaxID=392015 RepID=UPI0026EA5784|nr:SDR family oxidoreductase [Alicyclobacillus macrosporangiidus]MCL6597562.1 SDR family oxidoreductase [Alicyclobacillus macrosporangiidus]
MTVRTALVTSGAGGLGFAVVRTLLESGWDVCFTYRTSLAQAERLAVLARERGRRVWFAQADLLDRAQVSDVVAKFLSECSAIDAFVHNFGPFVFERIPLAAYTDEMWTRMMDGNLNNFFWIYRALIGGMRARGFGRIVTVGYDGAGEAAGWRHRSAYAAAKSALASLTRSIAREERDFGITANMVCPGDIRGENKERMIREVPPGPRGDRPPVGEDVARLIAFLCHEDSQQLNGTVTQVTGGRDIRAREEAPAGGRRAHEGVSGEG